MLVFTGFRPASPKKFVRTYKLGGEQFVVFVGTIVATLATDLLIGIAVGIALEMAFHLGHGTPVRSLLFRSDVDVVPERDTLPVVVVRRAAVFSNWLGVRKAVLSQAAEREALVLDLSDTRLVDHSVLEKLHELEREFAERGKRLSVIGLEEHTPLATHPLAARKNRRRETVPVG